MNRLAEDMAQRIERALKSGKLLHDGSYTIPALAVILGTTRAELRAHPKTLVAQPSRLRLWQTKPPQAGRLRHRQPLVLG
jgi:hypothetical protein